jgi:alpha-1,2-mannosyltransferase
VYNYWEPLHFLTLGRGFQTWEYSPLYALRSWAYIVLHMVPTNILANIFTYDKVNLANALVLPLRLF